MYAFMCPGQARVEPQTELDIATGWPGYGHLLEEAENTLAFDPIDEVIYRNSANQTRTSLIQPAVLTLTTARGLCLQEKGIRPSAVLGHSLGQYSALVLAGVLDFADALHIVYRRGLMMEEIIRLTPGSMLAITSADRDTIEGILPEAGEQGCVVVAGVNSSRQTVVSGASTAVDRIRQIVEERHLGTPVPLCVQVPFHSPILHRMREDFARLLNGFIFHPPQMAFIDNVTGQRVDDPEIIRANLVEHLTSPVLWADCVRAAHALGCSVFLELGHKRMLAQFNKHIVTGQQTLLWNELLV